MKPNKTTTNNHQKENTMKNPTFYISHEGRTLTTLASDELTAREPLPSILVGALKNGHLLVHMGDDGEYISDMDTKIIVDENETLGIKENEFFLDRSVLYYTGFHWQIINEQGQRISYSKESTCEEPNGKFIWLENVVDENGESDNFAETYDFDKLLACPLDEFCREEGFFQDIYLPLKANWSEERKRGLWNGEIKNEAK